MDEFMSFIEERQTSFDAQCNALRFNQNLTTLAALYIDVLTSNFGEKWDTTTLVKELDDIFEQLKNLGVSFMGHEISTRRTDKEDPYIFKFVETIPKMVQLKDENGQDLRDENGKPVKRQNGNKEVTKKKHMHSETMDILNAQKTNAFGIPYFRLYGEYHKGFYPTVDTYQSIQDIEDRNALQVLPVRKGTMQHFETSDVIYEKFFADTSERCKYGFTSLSEIAINGQMFTKPVGLIRLDFDVENGKPVIINIALLFNGKELIAGHVSETNLVPDTIRFIKKHAAENGIEISENCARCIIVDGTYATFKARLDQVEYRAKETLEQHKRSQQRLHEAMEREEERKRLLEEAEARTREEEKARLRAQREQERITKAAVQADKTAKKHQKDLENMMTTLVASILREGGIPGRAVYRSMKENIEADIEAGETTAEEVALIFEALDTLINQDTNAI